MRLCCTRDIREASIVNICESAANAMVTDRKMPDDGYSASRVRAEYLSTILTGCANSWRASDFTGRSFIQSKPLPVQDVALHAVNPATLLYFSMQLVSSVGQCCYKFLSCSTGSVCRRAYLEGVKIVKQKLQLVLTGHHHC